MMLELTRLNKKKVFLDAESIESIEEFETYSLITMSSGNQIKVKEYSTDISMELKIILEQLADDNKLTLALPGM